MRTENDLPDSQDPSPLDLDGLLDRLEGSSNASIGASEDTFVDIDFLSKDTLPEVQAPKICRIALAMGYGLLELAQHGGGQASGPSRTQADLQFSSTVFFGSHCRVRRGDSSLDIVIRPGDSILVERVGDGNIYIDGEIARPGPYAIPVNEPYFTLSRAITSARRTGPLG